MSILVWHLPLWQNDFQGSLLVLGNASALVFGTDLPDLEKPERPFHGSLVARLASLQRMWSSYLAASSRGHQSQNQLPNLIALIPSTVKAIRHERQGS